MKEITMSFEEFFSKDKEAIKTLDKLCGEILKNPKFKVAVITSIASMNMNICAYADDFDQLRTGKNQIVIALQISICSLCVLMCLLEIGKSLIGGRNGDVGSIVMKYLAAVCGVGIVPKAFSMIAKMFGVII